MRGIAVRSIVNSGGSRLLRDRREMKGTPVRFETNNGKKTQHTSLICYKEWRRWFADGALPIANHDQRRKRRFGVQLRRMKRRRRVGKEKRNEIRNDDVAVLYLPSADADQYGGDCCAVPSSISQPVLTCILLNCFLCFKRGWAGPAAVSIYGFFIGLLIQCANSHHSICNSQYNSSIQMGLGFVRMPKLFLAELQKTSQMMMKPTRWWALMQHFYFYNTLAFRPVFLTQFSAFRNTGKLVPFNEKFTIRQSSERVSAYRLHCPFLRNIADLSLLAGALCTAF